MSEVKEKSRSNVGGSQPELYSFSKLSCFDQCKYCFFLKYRTPKEKRPAAKENAFSLYGQYVHSLLEQYEKGELMLDELAPTYEDEFDFMVSEEFPPSPNPRISLYDSYYDSGYEFLKDYKGQRDKYDVLGVEEYFTVKIGDVPLRGFIDLILRDKSDGRIVVHDWKSKSGIKSKAEKQKYGRQLYLYSKYIEDKYDETPKTLRLYLFRKDTPVDIPYELIGREEAESWALNQVKNIEACGDWDDYTYDKFFCNYLCEFRDSCVWKEMEEIDCGERGNSSC